MVDPNEFIAPRNGFAMSLRDFISHLMNVLDQLGMSLHARTNFIRYGWLISVLVGPRSGWFLPDISVTIYMRFLPTRILHIAFFPLPRSLTLSIYQ